jgi:hypothetical protein
VKLIHARDITAEIFLGLWQMPFALNDFKSSTQLLMAITRQALRAIRTNDSQITLEERNVAMPLTAPLDIARRSSKCRFDINLLWRIGR